MGCSEFAPRSSTPPPGKRTESRPARPWYPSAETLKPHLARIPSLKSRQRLLSSARRWQWNCFVHPQFRVSQNPTKLPKKQGANWVKWILIAAGPLVLALVLLVVFTLVIAEFLGELEQGNNDFRSR